MILFHIPQSPSLDCSFENKNLIWGFSSSSGPMQQSSLLQKPNFLSLSAAPEHRDRIKAHKNSEAVCEKLYQYKEKSKAASTCVSSVLLSFSELLIICCVVSRWASSCPNCMAEETHTYCLETRKHFLSQTSLTKVTLAV